MASYGAFLIRRFISPHFLRGSTQIHVLFDNPGQLKENPKVVEQERRDSAGTSLEHTCWVLFDEKEVPTKWSDTLKCRQCKRSLTKFLSAFFVKTIKQSLNNTQSFITAGAMENDSDEAILVSKDLDPHPYPLLRSNAEESDIRIWLHVKQSAGSKVLIQPPDTDTYHVGLPFVTPQMEVVVPTEPSWRQTFEIAPPEYSDRSTQQGSRTDYLKPRTQVMDYTMSICVHWL